MKTRIIRTTIIAAAMLIGIVCIATAQTANDRTQALRTEIDAMTSELAELEMRYNRAVWDKFIAHSQIYNLTIPIYELGGHNFDIIIDTVRHIRKHKRKFDKLTRKTDALLNEDPEFLRLDRLYKSAKIRKEREDIYSDLSRRRRMLADKSKKIRKYDHLAGVEMRAYNLALTLLMRDYYERHGQPMPLTAIPAKELEAIRHDPFIYAAEVEISVLRNAIGAKTIELGRARFSN
ncbi:hypothetical protein LJC45_05550 [Alistipes sp. OttesenSCG-928-B03]|nr:hypothetical protein [Alistipes sp. OttesenSCG-928-B03]